MRSHANALVLALGAAALGAASLAACDPSAAAPDAGTAADAYVPPPPPRDAGPELCPAEGPLDARAPLRDVDLCAEGIVPRGFGLRWQHLGQRLARLALRVAPERPDGCPPGASMRGAILDAQASSGVASDAPDTAVAFLDYYVLGARDSIVTPDDAGAMRPRTARGSVTIELEPGATSGEGVALVDLIGAGIDGSPDLVVLVDGLELTTDLPRSPDYPAAWSPERGYALRGLGAAIGEVTRDDATGTLRVAVSGRLEHGTLERPAIVPGHDPAIPRARRRMIVRFVVLAADVPPSTASVSYRLSARRAPVLRGGAACRAAASETSVEIDGADALERGLVGLTRFDVALFPDEPLVGDLVRELSVRVLEPEYDPASGVARAQVAAYVSNEGPFPHRGLDARVEVDVALAQWSGGGAVVPLSIAAPVPAEGLASIPLPMR